MPGGQALFASKLSWSRGRESLLAGQLLCAKFYLFIIGIGKAE